MFLAPQNKNEGYKFLATAINSIDIEQCACVYAPRRCARHLSVNSTEFVSVRRAVICAGSTGLVEPLHPTSKLLCYTQNIVIDNNRNTINLISTSRPQQSMKATLLRQLVCNEDLAPRYSGLPDHSQ